MAPTKLPGVLSLYTAPPAPRIPWSIAECSAPHEGSGASRQYPYFTSGDLESERAIIFLGGLTNGMAAVPFVGKLSGELSKAGWRLSVHLCTFAGEVELLIFRIQPHWSSAYDGYGTSSLDTDVGEIGALVDHIRKEDGEYHPVPDQVPQLKTPYRSQNSIHHGPFDRIPRCPPLPHF